MTSENEGLREKRYNRGCSGPGCTRIPTGDFWEGINPSTEDILLPCPGSNAGSGRHHADQAAGSPAEKITGC